MRSNGIRPVLIEFVDKNPFIVHALIANAKGDPVASASSTKEYEDAYADPSNPLAGKEKAWFKRPFKDGKIHVTDLFTSKVTGSLILTISAPVFDSHDNIKGVIGLDILFEHLEKVEDEDEALLGATEKVPEYVADKKL
jgi:hypothetical protein